MASQVARTVEDLVQAAKEGQAAQQKLRDQMARVAAEHAPPPPVTPQGRA